jgi:hypothetical protein
LRIFSNGKSLDAPRIETGLFSTLLPHDSVLCRAADVARR